MNDCSPEPEMANLMASYLGQPKLHVLTNEQNLGFVKSANRGLKFCVEGDVILLNSDTRVFESAFDELWRVAYSSADIGTVTAISNNATIFSYPHPRLPKPILDDVAWSELAGAALRGNAGVAVDVPTAHGFCMLLKRELLDRIGPFNEVFGRGYGEENDFCCKAADLGHRNVAAAGVFVEHRESVSFGSEKQALLKTNLSQLATFFPEYTRIVMDFERHDELRRARWALDAYRLSRASEAEVSFALVVKTWLRGGSDVAIADLEQAVGYDGSRKLTLACAEDGRVVLETPDPLVRAVFQSSEVEPLFELLRHAQIRLVAVHQLLGFTAQFIERLAAFVEGQRSIYYFHDFYSVCPRVTMINALGEFCGGADASVCDRCIGLGGAHEGSRLAELMTQSHRELFRDLASRVRDVVAPSQDTADRVGAMLKGVRVSAIPHPQTGVAFPAGPVTEGSFENVILLGAIGPHKGSAKLLEVARRARLTHPELAFHVIGHTDIDDELEQVGNVRITGPYEREELPNLLAAARGRLALFLHGWPETFSYTLTEAVAHGLIPLVPDIGAPAARVRAAKFGYVFPFPIDAGAVLERIRKLSTGDADLDGGTPTSFESPHSALRLRKMFFDYEPAAVPTEFFTRSPRHKPRRRANGRASVHP